MRIFIDFDDVIFPLVNRWVEVLNRKYKLNVKQSDIKDWNFASFFPTLSENQVFNILYRKDFWSTTVEPLPHSIEYLKKLWSNYECCIATASDWKIMEYKFKYLNYYFPYIEWKDIIIIYKKHLLKGDVLIDDKVDNLLNFDGKRFLIKAYHNDYFTREQENNIIRVNNLKDVWKMMFI